MASQVVCWASSARETKHDQELPVDFNLHVYMSNAHQSRIATYETWKSPRKRHDVYFSSRQGLADNRHCIVNGFNVRITRDNHIILFFPSPVCPFFIEKMQRIRVYSIIRVDRKQIGNRMVLIASILDFILSLACSVSILYMYIDINLS